MGNSFDMTSTQIYVHIKDYDKKTSEINYKEEFKKNRGHMLGTEITPEMAKAKELLPIKKQAYEGQSKKDQVNTHVGPDGQEIAHATNMTKQASQNVYKEDFKKDVQGKSAANPAIAYPEHDRLKKIKDATSKPKYEKDAKEALHKNVLSADAPEFVRAKDAAKNASDREYTKQKKETIANYRGFQTMDARKHPDVTKAAKANALTSNKAYREEWENDKSVVYFPYTFTPEYETKSGLQKLGNEYTMDHDQSKDKNKFDVTSTPVYTQLKGHEQKTSDINYKGDFENNKGKMLGTDVTPEMVKAKELLPMKKQAYEEQSKKDQAKTHVGPDGQEISHAVVMSKQASKNVYKEDFRKDIQGKSVANPAIAYPEHDRLKKIKDATDKPKYEKDAKQALQRNVLSVDAPEFIRAKEAAKNASDREYTKQKKEVIANYRGFQTMDAREHPDVTKAAKANEVNSEITYRQDYEDKKDMVYYPYTITPEYDTKHELRKRDMEYTQDHENTKSKNRFNTTETPVYAHIKKHDLQTADVNYKGEFQKNKGKLLGTDVTPEMAKAKELLPMKKQAYEEK